MKNRTVLLLITATCLLVVHSNAAYGDAESAPSENDRLEAIALFDGMRERWNAVQRLHCKIQLESIEEVNGLVIPLREAKSHLLIDQEAKKSVYGHVDKLVAFEQAYNGVLEEGRLDFYLVDVNDVESRSKVFGRPVFSKRTESFSSTIQAARIPSFELFGIIRSPQCFYNNEQAMKAFSTICSLTTDWKVMKLKAPDVVRVTSTIDDPRMIERREWDIDLSELICIKYRVSQKHPSNDRFIDFYEHEIKWIARQDDDQIPVSMSVKVLRPRVVDGKKLGVYHRDAIRFKWFEKNSPEGREIDSFRISDVRNSIELEKFVEFGPDKSNN